MSTNSLLIVNYRTLSCFWLDVDIIVLEDVKVNNLLKQNILTVNTHFC